MTDTLIASIIDALLGWGVTLSGQDPGNRFSLEGVTFGLQPDGTTGIRIRRLEVSSLRLASGPLLLEVGRLVLDQIAVQVRVTPGRAYLCALDVANAEFTGLKLQGPLQLPQRPSDLHASHSPAPHAPPIAAGPAPAQAWRLGPLAEADGRITAEILDAHLLFDANVTVPIRHGQINFNDASVEHVGPDSRMGISRLGLYVDAPNGRSYLFQFPSTPISGVTYEQRGTLLGPWVADRGRLQLQAFSEGLLRQAWGAAGLELTAQARALFDRTALAGDMQLGDGKLTAPGMHAELFGRAGGRNAIRLHSQAVGRGLSAVIDSLAVRDATLHVGGRPLHCAELMATIALRLCVESAQMQFALDIQNMKAASLRLQS